MNFTHQPYCPGETIAAVATPPGEGGVAIIRISGDDALNVASKVFSGPVFKYKTHTAHFGRIVNFANEPIDDVLLLVMLGNRSYTGENTVEIHCHGGSLITRRVLQVVLEAGARAALPGEFTFKAFMNGKIDLLQAEAVQDLICAKSERALDAAENQLKGSLSEKISHFQQTITQIGAILEAWVDFPEEGLEFATMEELVEEIEEICLKMEALLQTFHDGKILHDGLSLCLVGCPNVGKSSLMNALLDKNRAIVSSTPGTTRDVLEDYMRLNGLHLKLSDTAGIRETDEMIELEGIKRSKETIEQSDLILMVLDASIGLTPSDHQVLSIIPAHKTVIVWNKIDLVHRPLPKLEFPKVIEISAIHRSGMENLIKAIDDVIWNEGPPSKEEILITNIRHKEALEKAIFALRNVQNGLLTSISPEFLTIDMRLSLSELGKIIGINVSEDILSAIFSKFCIGK